MTDLPTSGGRNEADHRTGLAARHQRATGGSWRHAVGRRCLGERDAMPVGGFRSSSLTHVSAVAVVPEEPSGTSDDSTRQLSGRHDQGLHRASEGVLLELHTGNYLMDLL